MELQDSKNFQNRTVTDRTTEISPKHSLITETKLYDASIIKTADNMNNADNIKKVLFRDE